MSYHNLKKSAERPNYMKDDVRLRLGQFRQEKGYEFVIFTMPIIKTALSRIVTVLNDQISLMDIDHDFKEQLEVALAFYQEQFNEKFVQELMMVRLIDTGNEFSTVKHLIEKICLSKKVDE